MEIALFAAMNRLSISRVLASVPRILLRAILVFGAKRLIGAAPAAATTKSQQQLDGSSIFGSKIDPCANSL
jgi:hypothetical protein